MNRILNQVIAGLRTKLSPASLVAGSTIFLLLVMAGASGTVRQAPVYTGEIRDQAELLGEPVVQSLAPSIDANIREIRIQHGDTVANLLSSADVRDDEFLDFLHRSREAEHLFRQLVPGRTITFNVSATGALQALTFPLSGSKDKVLSVTRSQNGLTAEIKAPQIESSVIMQTALIRHSLFGAADDAGIPDDITNQLTDCGGRGKSDSRIS